MKDHTKMEDGKFSSSHASARSALYLHGFNSSPRSTKARQTVDYLYHLGIKVTCPQLSHNPTQAIQQCEDLLEKEKPQLLVGSSLGGFYASVLLERHRWGEPLLKAALINPAVDPTRHLGEGFLGPHTNHYTGETYEFTREYGLALREMTPEKIIEPEAYLVLLQTGDTILNYRWAMTYYMGASIDVVEGGSHAYDNYGYALEKISAFLAVN
jgi:predicted esterase YcpF (UPF0227 family)